MRFQLLFGLSFALASVVYAAEGLPGPTVPDRVGVNIHFTSPKPGEMEMLAESGVKWVRMDLLWNESWSSSEKEKGVYDFSKYDELVKSADAHGIRVLAILAYGSKLYDDGLSPHTDEGRAAYARWAVAAAKHFAGRGIIWENWNEPNGRQFWKPTPNADDYAKLAVTVGKAFRESVPEEILVGPALAKFDWSYLETCFKAGVLDYWSAVTVHPYRDSDPETVADDYRKLRRLIAEYAPRGKKIPIFSGEWGYFLTLGPTATPERQGKLLARQWLTNIENEVSLSIWYDWKDDGPNPNDRENRFGTVGYEYSADKTPVYQAKPGYLAAKTLTTNLRGYRFSKRLPLADSNDHVLLFENGESVAIAAWTAGSEHEVTVPASAGTFRAISHTGEALPDIAAEAAGLKLMLGDSPKYLFPQESNDLLQLAAAWERLPLELMAAAPGTLSATTSLKNVTAKPIHVVSSTGEELNLAPGESGAFEISRPVQSDDRQPVRVQLNIDGVGSLAQDTAVMLVNPLVPVLLPLGQRECVLTIKNVQRKPFSGTMNLTFANGDDRTSVSAKLELAADEAEKSVKLELPKALPVAGTVRINFNGADGQLVGASTCSYSAQPAEGLGRNGYGLWPMANQNLVAAAAPEAPPSTRGPVMRLDYSYTGQPDPKTTPATKPAAAPVVTLSLTPKANEEVLTTIKGRPTALRMWIYGDGSGNGLCARFVDSTGQVFQPNGEPIKWKGWKCVTFALDEPGVWHYAGAKDEVIHYPIKWNTLLLMDAAGKKAGQGTIYFCSPTIVWDEVPQD